MTMTDEFSLRLADGIYFAAIPGAKGALVSRDRTVVQDAERKLNAFEPMRKALDMLGEQIKVRIDPGLLEELGRAGVGDITIRADVLLACLRALRAADETAEGR